MRPGDGDERHGTVNGYSNLHCRCDACRAAWATHMRGYWTPERTAARNAVVRAKYKRARAAGYSALDAQRRQHWGNPLAVRGAEL